MGRTLLRWLLVGAFIGIGIGAVVGLVLSRFVDLPAVESLMTYRPSAATRVLARDGSILGSFAAERRIPVGAEEIPKVFRDAVIAVEDANFYRHTGVDPQGIVRAALRNLFTGRWSQGASTITQQLPRSLGLLSREKKFTRKVKEMLLAIEIEQRLSKDQIFTLYANQVNFGHGNYGVEAASRFYFGKSAKELALPEAALLAGLPQRPGELSPIDFPKRALERRNHVLARMLEERYITKAVYDAARATPLNVSPHYDRDVTAAYFVEEVRRSIEDRYGTKKMLEGGLEVQTTLDDGLQRVAEDSLREGLVELQQRLGWPGARRNVLGTVPDLKEFRDESWPFIRWRKQELVYALATDVQATSVSLLIDGRTGVLPVEGARWTGRTNLLRLVRRGDVLLVRLVEIPPDKAQPVKVQLMPEPKVEGAIVVLDNRTGAILALVGGFDFNRSQFDRAMQAKRQCGSAFKPFVYLAAWEHGFSPADLIFDGPSLLPDEKGELTYVPLNYYRRYEGLVTFRYAVEHSLNASAAKVQQLVTGQAVIDVAHRLGVKEPLAPYSSLALGTFELPVVELAAAYTGIANRGQVAEPYFIARVKDEDGKVVLETKPKVHQAVREDTAYLMTHVMEGVIQRGTAAAANDLPGHLAGKTGTTDRFTDAWFIGFSPRITCAVWTGRDLKEPIGAHMTGAEAALPTWIRFMKAYLDSQSEGIRQEDFPVPAGVTLIPVDRNTGLRATTLCGDAVLLEAVPSGHEPPECDARAHAIAALPWLQQLAHYTPRPGEPPTTPEAILAADRKLAEEVSSGRR
ncbi:MAG TPA: PBP1A family penicillin-binding protein [Thermoanaerobaculaceae bacterium]|nr:PBP1A family penicillin-binding protein [Thermoanaerobaculaceae bacterium]